MPRKAGGSGNHTVRGLLGVSSSSTIGTCLHIGDLGSRRCVGDRCMLFYAGGNIVGGASLRRCSHPHRGNIGTVAVHRSSQMVRIHVAGKGGRVVVTGHGKHTVHFRRTTIHMVNHATAKIHNVALSSSKRSRMVNVVYVGSLRARSMVIISRRNCNGHSSVRSCHGAGHNNGNIGAVGVARGANGLIAVGSMASRGSLVVVGGSNVAVHLGMTSIHVVNHTARKIHLVGLRGHGSRVNSMYGIASRDLRSRIPRRRERKGVPDSPRAGAPMGRARR